MEPRRDRRPNLLEHPLLAPFFILVFILFFIWIDAIVFKHLFAYFPQNSPFKATVDILSGGFNSIALVIPTALIAFVGIVVLRMLVGVWRR